MRHIRLGVSACTPKPVSAEPVVESFLSALESRDNATIGELVDNPSVAESMYNSTFEGLQAEGWILAH